MWTSPDFLASLPTHNTLDSPIIQDLQYVLHHTLSHHIPSLRHFSPTTFGLAHNYTGLVIYMLQHWMPHHIACNVTGIQLHNPSFLSVNSLHFFTVTSPFVSYHCSMTIVVSLDLLLLPPSSSSSPSSMS